MAGNDCGHHGNGATKLCCWLFGAILGLIFLVLFIILLIWLIFRPTKPQFILKDATLNTFNFSPSADLLTSSFQITLFSRNPNSRLGIDYDALEAFATYQNQQITLSTLLPPTYQGHKDVSVWSSLLTGNDMLVTPYIRDCLTRDQTGGTILINIKVSGNMRWTAGTSVLGKNIHLNVNCPLLLTYGSKNNNDLAVGPGIVKYLPVQSCDVGFS